MVSGGAGEPCCNPSHAHSWTAPASATASGIWRLGGRCLVLRKEDASPTSGSLRDVSLFHAPQPHANRFSICIDCSYVLAHSSNPGHHCCRGAKVHHAWRALGETAGAAVSAARVWNRSFAWPDVRQDAPALLPHQACLMDGFPPFCELWLGGKAWDRRG